MNWPVVGVDPGGRTTGIVRRTGRRVDEYDLVDRGDDSMPVYIGRVLAAVARVATGRTPKPLLAVEDVVPPSGHIRIANVAGLLDTAQVLGGVLARWPNAVVVRPAGHGSHLLAVYPSELVGRNEPKGAGRLRHCRSAYDIAGAVINATGRRG